MPGTQCAGMNTQAKVANVAYPTPEHERASRAAASYFAGHPGVDAVLLVGSCARGKASPDSCLDLSLRGRPRGWQVLQRRSGSPTTTRASGAAASRTPGAIASTTSTTSRST